MQYFDVGIKEMKMKIDEMLKKKLLCASEFAESVRKAGALEFPMLGDCDALAIGSFMVVMGRKDEVHECRMNWMR